MFVVTALVGVNGWKDFGAHETIIIINKLVFLHVILLLLLLPIPIYSKNCATRLRMKNVTNIPL